MCVIDEPTHYTDREGGVWQPYVGDFTVSNPALLCHKPKAFIACRHKDGGYTLVHSFKWADGSRWDALNGMTDGELPR